MTRTPFSLSRRSSVVVDSTYVDFTVSSHTGSLWYPITSLGTILSVSPTLKVRVQRIEPTKSRRTG